MTDDIRVIIGDIADVSARVDAPVVIGGNRYEGDYEVTPSQTAQVLETAGLLMTDNVTVNPIPQNYGLITYDGYGITVS